MTLRHKIKFILAVFKGDVNKVTEVEKPVIITPKLTETMSLKAYLTERKRYLEKLTEGIEGQEGLEEVDSEYALLEEVEKLSKTWQIKT